MAKKISEVIIKVKGEGLTQVDRKVKSLLDSVEELTAASKGLNAALASVDAADEFSDLRNSVHNIDVELQQLNSTSKNVLKVLETQLQQTAYQTEEAAEAADRLGDAFSRAGGKRKGAGGLANGIKDVNRQGTNQVRTFSKMARAGGSITIMYAAVAANVFALSEAFRILNEAASVERLSEVSSIMSNEMAISINGTADALREVTDNALSSQEALRLASASAAFGFSTSQMEELALVAKRASVVLGVDMTDALNRVTRGISKQEIELLDELGLTVRLTEAFEEYAGAHGLAADSLTSFQRQQALTNTVIAKSEQNLGAVDAKLESTAWEKFGATVSTSTNQLLRFVSTNETVLAVVETLTGYLQQGIDNSWAKNFKAVSTEIDKINSADMPGLKQLLEARGTSGVDRLKAFAATQVEIQRNIDKLQEANASEKARMSAEGEEYSQLEIRQRRVLEFTNKKLKEATLETGRTVKEAETLLELFRDINRRGRDFTNTVNTTRSAILGSATDTLSPFIEQVEDGISRLQAEASKSGITISRQDALDEIGITQQQIDLANTLNGIQAEGLNAVSTELFLLENISNKESLKLSMALEEEAVAKRKIELLRAAGASEAKILEQVRKQKDAAEDIRKIKERRFFDDRSEVNSQQNFDARNSDPITQARVSLTMAQVDLDLAREKGVVSDENLDKMEQEVEKRKRSLVIAKELSKEQEKQAYFSIASDLASNIGTLDTGLGQTTVGLIDMANGWDTLGDSAASSAEKIKAASQVAGGFQAALSGLITSASQMVASGIDAEIAAVKSMGLTQEQEDKKVLKLQRKKIKEQEKYTKASILLNTAMGIARSLGELPFPANFVVAGLTAAAGALAYQQASNTAASQLASLSSGKAEDMKIEVGKSGGMSTDVSSAASAGERGQMAGDRGVYGRASAGTLRANSTYITSESGRELVVPKVDSKIYNSTDTDKILENAGKDTTPRFEIHVNAIDSKSLEERMPEFLDMLREEAEQRGFTLGNS